MNAVVQSWKNIWLYVVFMLECFQVADVQHSMSMYSMQQIPFSYYGQSTLNGSPMSNMMQFAQQMMQQSNVQRAQQEIQRTQQRMDLRSQQYYNNRQREERGPNTQEQPSRKSAVGVAVPFPASVPVPFPMAPVQYAVPGLPLPQFCSRKPRPPSCPPCPPCTCFPCMPAFFSFCSPCHLKCRCRAGQPPPVPLPPLPPVPIPGQMPALPMAMPGISLPYNPAQVMIVPFPSQSQEPATTVASDDSEVCEDDSLRQGRDPEHIVKDNVRSRKNVRVLRERPPSTYLEDSENELLVPMLSYVGQNGKVKFKTPISESEASELLENGRRFRHNDFHNGRRSGDDDSTADMEEGSTSTPEIVHVVARDNGESGSDLQVLTEGVKKRVWLKNGNRRVSVKKGSKSLVFSPTGDKKIANLSVTFQVV